MSKTQIPTGGIADDAVSEEHLDATALTGNTALAALPASTDELLISDGGTLKRLDFTHITPGIIKLGSIASSSAAGNASVNGIFSDTYQTYFFYFEVLIASNGQQPMMQFVDSGGNAISATNYYFAYTGRDQGGNTEAGDQAGAAGFKFGSASSGRTSHVWGYIAGPTSGADNNKKICWQSAGFDSSNNVLTRQGAGFYTASTDYTGLNILSTSGNITQHSLQVYGIHESLKFGG